MKKLTLLFALVLAATGFAGAQKRSVNFEHITFAEALAKAKAANKPIFMDGFADWCGPCKYMASTVFTQNKVADFFNENFINVKYDMEKGEGKDLAAKYSVNVYPTFLILDSTGTVVHKIVGGDSAEPFIEKVKLGLDPATSLKGQTEAYQKGNRDAKFIRSYLTTLQDAYMVPESEAIAKTYLSTLKEKDRVTKDSWAIYKDFVNDPFSKDFTFILTNRLKFTKEVGDSAVNAKIDGVFLSKTMRMYVNRRGQVYSKDESKKLRELIETSSPLGKDKYIAILDMADTKASKNGSALVAIAEKALKTTAFSEQESYSILEQATPVAIEYASKNDCMLLVRLIDERIAKLTNEKGKPYFENLKQQLNDKINETGK